MRKIIAALVVSVDGFIEGPNGELDWVDTWEDPFDLLPQIDTCILGRGMYPGYEQYWGVSWPTLRASCPSPASLLRRARSLTHTSRKGRPTSSSPRTLDNVAWKNTRIVRDIDEIRRMKQQPGKDMHAVGGATLIGSLMNAGLIDELRLVVHPSSSAGARRCSKTLRSGMS